jgi:N-acetylglucosamine-6-phosphate deacetylase
LVIRGGGVVDRFDGRIVDVCIEGGVISAFEEGAADPQGVAVLDASDCFVLPGFIDVQLNGGWGVDFTTQPQRLDEVAMQLPQTGVTSFVPTVISTSPGNTARAVTTLAGLRRRIPGGARQLGTHLEGPFLDPARAGAHPRHHLRKPSLDEAAAWTADAGVVMVTLAPELDGALDVIRLLVASGVVVCAGHTAADASQLALAIEAGLTGATHLYNAMGPFGARAPATVGAVLANRSLVAGLIVDGLHVDPIMVAVAWRALGRHGIALVTDAITALGRGPGDYGVGDTRIIVDGTAARTVDGILAGSVLPMDQAVRNLMMFTGCPLGDASIAASATPAALLNRSDIGHLAVGATADVVLLDNDLRVVATVVEGEVVFDRQHRRSPGRPGRPGRRA